jgi:3-carboxy-cis,cis-muconate cycloisomerase
MTLLGPLFRWDAIEPSLSDRARVQAMLDFEAALARAEASTAVIPVSAAPAIVAKCSADLFDAEAIARAAAAAGNPAIPLVHALTALVARDDPAAARFVHWGATSQDVMDTGLVLQLRPALAQIEAEMDRLADALAVLAERHRTTVVAGRTWMQQAVPTTFGLKVAGWLDAVDRHRGRLAGVCRGALVLQFGGAVGSLAALGTTGLNVSRALAAELQLAEPDMPWHAHRDRVAEVATTLGLCAGTFGKVARDISLYMQTEVAEVFEPGAKGRGGSSTMPHKRNPVTSAIVLAAAMRAPGLVGSMLSAMVQEEERGLGGWHAEWEVLPELVGIVGGALHHLTETVAGLEVDAVRMRANLDATQGLIFAEGVQMALRGKLGGAGEAQPLVDRACERARAGGRHLREVLEADPEVGKHLPPAELARLFDPQHSLGASSQLIDRVLAAHSARRAKAPGGDS